MKRLSKIFLLIVAIATLAPLEEGCGEVLAQGVSFTAQAPKQVILGRPFQLSYTVNQRAKDLRAPEFVDFDLLAGPYSSTSSSTSYINGKRTSSYQQTYTYTLMARREGEFTISPATITVDGDRYQSNGVRITVLPEDKQPANGGQSGAPSSSPKGESSASHGEGQGEASNIFVRTIVSKTKVSEQEAISVAYKLYFAGVDVAQLTNNTKLPEFTGFLKQDIEQGEIQTELEHYNGRNYQTAVLYRTLLYPQHAGDITIEPASFEAVLRVQTRAQVRSIFDDFFGSYTNVTKTLAAPGATIHVSALPAGKPSGFSGGVGQYTMTGSISATQLQANEAVTIKLDIKGNGNMKLIKTPAIDWPEGFEPYDPKVTNNFKTTASGMSGTKSIEYLAIPRAGGDYTIPAITFSYFDTDERAYRTLSTEDYTIHVERGAGESESAASMQNYVAKEDIKQLNTDIRYIYTGPLQEAKAPLAPVGERGWGIGALYLIPALLALIALVLLRKQIRENADITRVRYKKANKVAQRRLKTPKKLLAENDGIHFYEEIEKALLTYLSDRLSIPTADLSKETISGILSGKKVPEELVKHVNDVISTAEFARYAPSAAGSMQEMYDMADQLIDQLENCKL